MNIIKRYHLFLIISFSVLIFISCKKEIQDPIPDVYVNFSMNISSTFYIELSSVGGWVNVSGGYRGITVYRLSSEEFVAFERACPFDWKVDSAVVSVEPSGLIMKCPSCSSEFLIIDGSVVNGPSALGMKRYNTNFDGQFLYIYN
ncbi:MAG TPA: hypothetical protein PKL96_00715 [Bacteroidales bacterium]|mgnify:FL=1|nr:hypothetical protein [Bacteroidales bacterium]HPS26048.1 hypothetical protein [Bacteroidales bacterium]